MRKGKQTVEFERPPIIIASASAGGVKEGEGPLRSSFDIVLADDMCGEDSWEKAEAALQKRTAMLAVEKAGLRAEDIDYILGGDLINQCVSTHYALRNTGIPFFGLYGACSTMTESLTLAAMLVGGGFANRAACVTSSHFCSAEKQFRNPLEYGGQRTPSAQWTVTGAGCCVLASEGEGPRATQVTTGKIIDKGITDSANMGAAMAPAAIDTLRQHFEDTGKDPSYYDLILTGDLGIVGSEIFVELMREEGYDIAERHNDCGKLIYDAEKQDAHAGGSGCGCCASVLCGHILGRMREGKLNKVLVMATGALMNTMTLQQGESIPAIAHAVVIER